jgi:excisionase family DNA binding protein
MTSQRLTVQEAAEVLGTSVDAVRMRVRRGSLESEKDHDGRVHVWVHDDSSETKPRPDVEYRGLYPPRTRPLESSPSSWMPRGRHAGGPTPSSRSSRRPTPPYPPGCPSWRPRRSAQKPPRRSRSSRAGVNLYPDAPGPQEGVQRPWWRRLFGR